MSEATDSTRIATYLGATHLGAGRCLFRVWAPRAERVDVHLDSPQERMVPMSPTAKGYHELILDGVEPGALYRYRLDGKAEWPDPASCSQPQGVHGPSEVVSRDFEWSDFAWRGLPLKDFIFYELHVGTFTDEGTFEAVIPHLEYLKSLGITAIELMPVAQFPGHRNWGYDGVYPYAVQHSYGGSRGLKRLVDQAHRHGLATVLDVVYNHLGPEGNYLGSFAPYFTERYRTPWGHAVNFDGPDSDEVRRYFIENALYWFEEFHIDALRLDAVHAIADQAPRTFLEELGLAVAERIDRRAYLIPESAANDARLVRPREIGGYGLDAVWNDDFHHALHTRLTGERDGYYRDYGEFSHLEKAFREGFVYSGEYSSYRRRRHGIPARDVPVERFVVFAQNHDQVGNRLRGDRLTETLSFEQLKLAAGAVLLSPFLPLLFMGEEYGEEAPFPYFVSHSDPELIEAVRRGRKEEFASFGWQEDPPDPQAEATFRQARLRHDLPDRPAHGTLLRLYEALIRFRRELAPLARRAKERMKVVGHERLGVMELHYWTTDPSPSQVLVLFHFGDGEATLHVSLLRGTWRKRLDSAEQAWEGPGSMLAEVFHSEGERKVSLAPWSFVLYEWDPSAESRKL